MCRPSNIDGRCEIRLLYLLKLLILELYANYAEGLHFSAFIIIAGKLHFILGTELWGSRYEELLRLVKSYIIDIWELCKSKLYGSGTGPLQYRSRPARDTTCQGKGKFGKLGGEKSCIVVYGSARSSECEAHNPRATATI